MSTERWARAGLRLVSPAAALLLLPSILRGIPCQPPAAPYLLGALVAVAVWLAVRRDRRWPFSQSLWAAAALWLALVSGLWHLEALASARPGTAERRMAEARGEVTGRFEREVHRLDFLLEEAASRAGAPAEEDDAELERWKRAVAATRLGEADALALYDAGGALVAWSGVSAAAGADFLLDATLDRTSYSVTLQGEAAHLFAAHRVGAERVLVSERRMEPHELTRPQRLAAGPRPEVSVEILARGTDRRAYGELFARRAVYRPRGPAGESLLLFPLRAPDGAVLAVGRVRDLPLQERQAAVAGRWQDLGVLGLGLLLLGTLRRLLIGFPALTGAGTLLGASAIVWIGRAVLSVSGFPHLPLLRPLFDYRDYTSPVLGAWSRSPGDLLLTVLAALVQGALLCAASAALPRRASCDRRRALAGWAALAAGGASAVLALYALVRTLARDARPMLLDVDWRQPDPVTLLLQTTLFAGTSALAMAVVALGRWAGRRCLPRPETGWVAELPSGGRLLVLGLLGVGGVTLAYYPLLAVESEASRRGLVRSHVLPQILDQQWRREVALRESLRKVLQSPDLTEALRAGFGEPDPALAYRLWARTELAAEGYESSLRIVDARGRVVSRFGLNLPRKFEEQLERTILAGPGPARARVPLLSLNKTVLFGRRPVAQGDEILGGVEIVVSDDYDNVPFVFSSDPYTLLFRSPSVVLTRSALLSAPPHFTVYNADSQAALFTSDPTPPPPLPDALAARLAREPEPVWRSVPHGRQRLRLLYARRGDEVFAVGYQRESPVRLAAGCLQAGLQNAVLAALLAGALALAIAPTAARRAARGLRAPASGQTFYRRLLATLAIASLVPLVALALFLEGMLAHEFREEIQRLGTSALTVARRVVADYLTAVARGSGTPDDDLLFWLSQVTRQDIHIYRGSELTATSRRELFASGLLPTRLGGDVYRDLVEERLPTSLREERLGSQRFYVISGRLDLSPSQGSEWILSLPLALQQEEVEGKLREVRQAVLLTTALLVLLLSLLSYAAARRIARPLGDLARAATRLARGDLSVRVERQADAELQALIDAFNRMAAAIRAQQDDLRARRDYIEKILLNATTGVVSFDPSGRVVTVNPSARLLTGADLEPGAPLRPALREAGLAELAALLPGGVGPERAGSTGDFSERREEVAIGSGADERRLRAVLVPLREQDRPAGGLLLLEDITENVRSNRLRAWAEMAQRIAHEVKNPLTPIQLSAEHLRHVYRDQPKEFERVLEECVRTITDQVRALRQMAREFSTYARIPELRPEIVDLREMVEETLAPYETAAPPGLRIERRCGERPLKARVDRNLVRRALVNLVENSLEAVQGRGTIRIGLEPSSEDGRRQARIVVDDDGPGIDPAVLPRLFEPFFSTKGSGTGLGLAIARQAVEANGGGISVERPESGRGTRMVILLPAAED